MNIATLLTLTPREQELLLGIRGAINENGAEADSSTPDIILAEFAVRCLAAYSNAVNERDQRYTNAVRSIIAAEFELAAKLAPEDPHWVAHMADGKRIVEIGLGAYIAQNSLTDIDLGTNPPIPWSDYSDVWGELRGYLEEAAFARTGEKLDPAYLLDYMDELKERVTAPTRNWLRQHAGMTA